MASGLRAKLNAIGAAASGSVKQAPRHGGVAIYSDRRAADMRLFALEADGLRRIGWNGRAFDVRRCLFLDTETTGLSGGAGTVAFLVGLGFVQGEDFIVEQYLMRDYADEADMLAQIARRMRDFNSICTFNGNHFDLPLLQTRFTMCRMRDEWRDLEPLDLLHPARRTWKLRIGSCRLSRIEELILGQGRGEDLPGADVPQRYFDYLKTGDADLLEAVVRHNRQDIVTLATLLVHLCGLYAHPERETDHTDAFSMGKALERQGELKPARELYKIAAIPPSAGSISAITGDQIAAQAEWRLYLLARKNHDLEAMRGILERMALRRQMREKIYIELAKLYEHGYRRPRRALRYADLAAHYLPPEEMEALNHRRQRLRRKIENSENEIRRKSQNGISG